MRLHVRLWLGCLVIGSHAAACTEGSDAPMLVFDSGVKRDAGNASRDAGTMPGQDAGHMPPGMDGGLRVDGGARVDGGIVRGDGGGGTGAAIDGVLGTAEWASATVVSSARTSSWGTGNELRRMLVRIEGSRLYVGIEGHMEPTNAIVVYVDRALSGPDGAPNVRALADTTGSLDDAISANLDVPAGFRPDFAWGTRMMSHVAMGTDAAQGWRDVSTSTTDFGWEDAASAPSACSATACETSIPMARLGGSAPRTIALFARITNAMGNDFSNQSLPEDDEAMPSRVMALMRIADGVVAEDAGTPLVDAGVAGTDAGTPLVDAGVMGVDAGVPLVDAGSDAGRPDAGSTGTFAITVDGNVSGAEWACGVSYTNTVMTAWGPNYVTKLRVCADATRLYVALEGTVETVNAMLFYLDTQLGSASGVTINTLTDGTGALDDAISAGITTPAMFRADFAFGTKLMSHTATGSDAQMGWRDIATNPANFGWESTTEAPAVCSAVACETSIALARLGVTDVHQMRFFARLGNGTGTALSNQCLPEDNAAMPGSVTQLGALP